LLLGQVELKQQFPNGSHKMILNLGDTFYEEAITLASYIDENKRKLKNLKLKSIEANESYI
jgi:hypothetical protein